MPLRGARVILGFGSGSGFGGGSGFGSSADARSGGGGGSCASPPARGRRPRPSTPVAAIASCRARAGETSPNWPSTIRWPRPTPTPTSAAAATPISARSAPGAGAPGERLFRRLWTLDLPREHGFEPLEIEGTLPAELRGTLFRNGPGQHGQHGRRYSHPFEGDGAVTAVRFEGGRALGASQITPTAGLREERAAGKILYGLSAPWWRRMANVVRGRQKNTANTSVVVWQGRLFALLEAARPTELDRATCR